MNANLWRIARDRMLGDSVLPRWPSRYLQNIRWLDLHPGSWIISICNRQLAVETAKMKWTTIATALTAVPLASAAGYSKEQYRSGEVMEKMMMAKEVRQLILLALTD